MPNVPEAERSRPGLYKLASPASESCGVVLYRGTMNRGCTIREADHPIAGTTRPDGQRAPKFGRPSERPKFVVVSNKRYGV